MAATYEPIASTTLATAGTFNFVSIPSGYTDLVLVVSGQVVTGSTYPQLQFNGDTGNNYSNIYFSSNSTTLYTGGLATSLMNYTNGTNTPWLSSGTNTCLINIFNYSKTDRYKFATFEQVNAGTSGQSFCGARWNSLNAITSIAVKPGAFNFAVGTQATLYGIKAA